MPNLMLYAHRQNDSPSFTLDHCNKRPNVSQDHLRMTQSHASGIIERSWYNFTQ